MHIPAQTLCKCAMCEDFLSYTYIVYTHTDCWRVIRAIIAQFPFLYYILLYSVHVYIPRLHKLHEKKLKIQSQNKNSLACFDRQLTQPHTMCPSGVACLKIHSAAQLLREQSTYITCSNSNFSFHQAVHHHYFLFCCLKLSLRSLFISRSPNLAAKLRITWVTWTWRAKIPFWRFPKQWKDRELHLMTGTLPVLVSLMMTISVCQDRGALMRHVLMILDQPAPIPRGTVKMVTSTQNR